MRHMCMCTMSMWMSYCAFRVRVEFGSELSLKSFRVELSGRLYGVHNMCTYSASPFYPFTQHSTFYVNTHVHVFCVPLLPLYATFNILCEDTCACILRPPFTPLRSIVELECIHFNMHYASPLFTCTEHCWMNVHTFQHVLYVPLFHMYAALLN